MAAANVDAAGCDDRCVNCGASVLYVPTGAIKLNGDPAYVCLDAAPNPEGNHELWTKADGRALARVIEGDEHQRQTPKAPRYFSHHYTCPDGEKWRGKDWLYVRGDRKRTTVDRDRG